MLSLQQLGQEEALPRSSFFLSFNAYIFYLLFFTFCLLDGRRAQ